LRYAILSDIHGNYDALKAVLTALQAQRIEAYMCLGDIVGYGPQPVECLHEIRKYASIIIAGNHDYAVSDKIGASSFNMLAKEAMLWTRSKLNEADLDFLSNLPLEARLEDSHLVHGTLYAPELFDYVQTSYDAHLSMEKMDLPICFVGHSHVPVTFIQDEVIRYSLQPSIDVQDGNKVIVNVGSVGQPRDKDPRACYAIYDSTARTVSIERVHYNVEAVIGKIREAGLPKQLGERLRTGR
jgi:diadenosine tetraphosphatase ApaH/serine/threonine PP2A family protein phosphatase